MHKSLPVKCPIGRITEIHKQITLIKGRDRLDMIVELVHYRRLQRIFLGFILDLLDVSTMYNCSERGQIQSLKSSWFVHSI